jgi:hypothetical protein
MCWQESGMLGWFDVGGAGAMGLAIRVFRVFRVSEQSKGVMFASIVIIESSVT